MANYDELTKFVLLSAGSEVNTCCQSQAFSERASKSS